MAATYQVELSEQMLAGYWIVLRKADSTHLADAAEVWLRAERFFPKPCDLLNGCRRQREAERRRQAKEDLAAEAKERQRLMASRFFDSQVVGKLATEITESDKE